MFARQFRPSDGRGTLDRSEDALSRSITRASLALRKAASAWLLSLSAFRRKSADAPRGLPRLFLPAAAAAGEEKVTAEEPQKVSAAERRIVREVLSWRRNEKNREPRARARVAHLKDSRVKVTVHAEIPAKANEIRSTMNWSFART